MEENIEEIALLPNLKTLHLQGHRLTTGQIRTISGINSLTSLIVELMNPRESLMSITSMQQLHELGINFEDDVEA